MRQLIVRKTITDRGRSLDQYLIAIGRIDLLTPEEEVELAKKIKAWDKASLDKLVEANLRFVVSVAKQYLNQGLPLEDLINEGNLGLIKAAGRFDETRWFKFISFAVRRIRQSIIQGLAEHARVVRLPLNRIGALSKVTKTRDMLEQEFGREPSVSELADIINVTEEKILEELRNEHRAISFDMPTDEDGEGNPIIDFYLDPNMEAIDHSLDYTESLKKDIADALSALSPRQSEVLKLYYWIWRDEKMSLDDIWDHLGLTRERARQVKERAMALLKRESRSKSLRKHLWK